MGTTPPITTNNPQNTRSTKPDQANGKTTARQISHAIPPGHQSIRAQKPQNINDQISTLEIHSGKLHAKLLCGRGRVAVPVGGGAGLRCPWAAGPGCGARGRRQGLAGLRGDAPISDPAPLVWRAPEGPEGTGGLRGAAPNEVRMPSLAGGRGLRCPEHPWGHNTTGTNNVARPRPVSRPRPRHSVSAAQKDGTARNSASDQAVMSTWSSTAARPASRRATGTRNGEQDT